MAARLVFETNNITEILDRVDDQYKDCFNGENWIETANGLGLNNNNEFVQELRKVKQYFKVYLNREGNSLFFNQDTNHSYKINDFEKKLTIVTMKDSGSWFISTGNISNILYRFEDMEIKFDKPIYEFTDDEIIYSINNTIDGYSFDPYYNTKKVLVIIEYISQIGITESKWNKYTDIKVLKKIIKTETGITNFLNEDLILDYIYTHVNLQKAIVPLMAYCGMTSKEAENLKIDNIKENGVILTNGKYERFLPLSSEIVRLLKQTAAIQESKDLDGKTIFYSSKSYVLKSGRTTEFDEPLSVSSMGMRIKEFANYIENMFGEKGVKYNVIRTVGMIHNVHKLVELGMDKKEAIYNTFAKFGDWKYSGYSEDGMFLNIKKTTGHDKKVRRYLEKERLYCD
ncbi:hypothetical protein JXA27_06675 [Aerococcaceae bacterium zg-B36]|uniref:hypothetical protein n=1 Tax=Aerococcaceae bacterium zg-252 TaxID=2796928 RepID=UPI001BD8A1B2|nr:hypothetical protein [Aerococcaceae bacterium zg-B36]